MSNVSEDPMGSGHRVYCFYRMVFGGDHGCASVDVRYYLYTTSKVSTRVENLNWIADSHSSMFRGRNSVQDVLFQTL